MLAYHDGKKRLHEILSTIKLVSVLFSGVILLKTVSGLDYAVFEARNYFGFMLVLIATLIVFTLYYYWAFIWIKRISSKNTSKITAIESVVFLLVFFAIILATGANQSPYKAIFLFIIITSTIQGGMRFGLKIAAVSSLLVLGVDLAYTFSEPIYIIFEIDLIICAVFFLTAWALGYYVKIENEHIERLENLINIDSLTGLYNHRYFYDELEKKLSESKKNKRPLALILMDLDHFKQYNDCFGHQAGDVVLKQVGEILSGLATPKAMFARYGGDEFAVILTDCTDEEVFVFGEKIRKVIEYTKFEGEEQLYQGKLTMSVGISVYHHDTGGDEDLIKCADDALYRAKFYNRNRVEVYTSVLELLKEDIENEQHSLISSMKTLISIINAKDRYTYGHIEKVVLYAKLMAEELKLRKKDRRNLIFGAYIHDIGKINTSEQILNKQMPLSEAEWEVLKKHPVDGGIIVRPVSSLKDVIPIIVHHHERYDGLGYPDGLKGEEIPYLARVITVIDSFDAMTSDRPYKRKYTTSEAIAELKRCSGIQFDPEIVDIFIRTLEKNNIVPQKPMHKNNIASVKQKDTRVCV